MSLIEPWLLMIMLSVGPFNGQYDGQNDVWLHIQMQSRGECMQAAQDVMTTARIFQHLNPNLHVDAICRPNELMQSYEEARFHTYINYRQCLDLISKDNE
jgi:hypothetical protein